ncbi:MAG: hypothetical protein P1V36_00355 [Planctomycetota bacterium]|nr:hypothetical protein [Planctomycetota bacterium]
MSDEATKICKFWNDMDLGAQWKRDLIRLSELVDLPTIVFCGYTPGFNDGDPCTHSQMYAGIAGFNDDYYVFIDEDGCVSHMEVWDLRYDDAGLEDALEKGVSKEFVAKYRAYSALDYGSPEQAAARKALYDEPFHGFLAFITAGIEFVTETNTEGTIRVIDGKVVIKSEFVEYGY